jgi:hypothetical protein
MPRDFQTKDYDVVVVGGGMAGVCAAIASARHGARTAIVQDRPMFGGCASSEIRVHIVGASYFGTKKNLNESGILLEILMANKARNPYQVHSIFDTVVWEKVHFQENLDSYLNTHMEEAITDAREIKSVICYQSTTCIRYVISAKIFIDATGHGTLGAYAGAASRTGSEAKSEFNEPHAPETASRNTMGNTLLFITVDRGEPVKFTKPSWAYTFTEEDLRNRNHSVSPIDAGYWWVELGGDYDDIIGDAENIRDELLKCMYGVWDHIKNGGNHGAENYDLEWAGIIPGARESIRLEGDYILNENDLHASRVFEDAVAYGGYPIDRHVAGGIKALGESPLLLVDLKGCYTIPYRSYYSRNISNLMMAGRDISASQLAFASARIIGTCSVGGQAAGTAAALAIQHGCMPRQLSEHIFELQQTLLRDDCYIPGFANADANDLARDAQVTASSYKDGCEPGNVVNGIARTEGENSNCWESNELAEQGESITLTLKKAAFIHQIRIVFDPNLSLDIMPSLFYYHVLRREVKGMPVELVKDYQVEILDAGGVARHIQYVSGNIQRLNIINLPEAVECQSVKITVASTHGYTAARIFEVRIY